MTGGQNDRIGCSVILLLQPIPKLSIVDWVTVVCLAKYLTYNFGVNHSLTIGSFLS